MLRSHEFWVLRVFFMVTVHIGGNIFSLKYIPSESCAEQVEKGGRKYYFLCALTSN